MQHIRDNIIYLKEGSDKQREAYCVLLQLNIPEKLNRFNPIAVGTIPLGIYTSNNDLGIICEVYNEREFLEQINSYTHLKDFTVRKKQINGVQSIICSFEFENFIIEVFGQPVPTKLQNRYICMVVEDRLLKLFGKEAANAIWLLKTKGIKTEPAFSEYFNIPGDPYKALVELATLTDDRLKESVNHRMTIKRQCIFCRMVTGSEECSMVYEDKHTFAFMNLRQANVGHVLVIPRRHVSSIFEMEEETMGHIGCTIVKVSRAIQSAFNTSNLNIVQNNGEIAGQEIFHVHFHLFPRYTEDGLLLMYPDNLPLPKTQPRDYLNNIAAQIRARL